MSTLSSFSEHIARRFDNLRWNYMVVAVDRRSAKDPWWHRESTPTTALLLIAFNMVSAGLLMGTVFWVMCRASRKSNLRSRYGNQSKSQLNIAPTEALTLSFTVAVLIQGTILLVLQALQMSPTISPRTCHTVKDVLFPTLWIVGLVLLVFGAETLYRGFKKTRFPPREKNVLYLCWAIIIILVLLSWIPTRVRRSTVMECKTSLLSTVDMLSDVAFGISVTFISLLALMASVLTLQLRRSRDVNLMERIAATQMVYYMAIAAADFAFVVPFWARAALHIPQGITPMMAMVSINVIAIVMLFFQVLFRSSTEHMTIGYQDSCRDGPKTQGLKRKISSPIPIRQEMTPTRSRTSRARDWTRYSGYSRRKNAIDTDKSLPPTPTLGGGLQDNNNGAANNKKSSYAYSIFPTKASARKPKHPASSIYEEDELLVPPRPAFAGAHNRNSSEVSHATVQIGLRLSNLADAQRGSSRDSMVPERTAAFAMHSGFLAPQSFLGRSNNNHISATSLDVPVTLLRSPDTERPDVTFPVSEPAASVAPPTDSDSGRLAPSTSRPGSSRDGSSSGSGSGALPAVYKNLADLQKLLEVDLEAAQRAAAENETWPLRDPLPDLLPQKTYHPEEQ